MVTIIFSDTHLTKRFSQKKYNFLKEIIHKADRVIINGDLWEGYIVSFDEFVKSRWRKLFPLLKAKKTVYIYGNHDKRKYCDKRVNLFSDIQKDQYKLKVADKKLIIEHGNRISPSGDAIYTWFPINKYTITFLQFCYILLVIFFRDKFLYWYHKKHIINMEKWAKENLEKNQILVCGHGHLLEFNLKKQFISLGLLRCGYGQYLKIADEKMEIINERY